MNEVVRWGDVEKTLLEAAVQSGDVEVVRLVLDAGADPNRSSYHNGSTVLMAAAGERKTAIVRLLLERGADARRGDSRGRTALITLFLDGDCYKHREQLAPIAKALLDAGADANARDDTWLTTPLLKAVECGSAEAVKLLLDKGANLEVRDDRGRTPLARAGEAGSADVLEVLLDALRHCELRIKPSLSASRPSRASCLTNPHPHRACARRGWLALAGPLRRMPRFADLLRRQHVGAQVL